MEITVNSTQALSSALRTVQSGDTIKLAAGQYSDVVLYNIKVAGNITITSADPAHQATINGLIVNGSSGVTFKGLEFYVDPTKQDGTYQIFGSSNINFDRINMHGSLDGNPQNDKTGLVFQEVKNVSVTNSEFQQVSFAVGHQNSDGVTVSNNYFHDIRSDGVRGGGSSHVTITNNQFRDFYPIESDHPDAIQFWTTNAKSSASDIVITGNIVMRGAGQPTQGIFFRDEQEIYPYKNVTISDNIVIGANYNAITVNHAENVKITNNTVAGLVDQRSWISVGTSTGVTVTNNKATEFGLGATNTGLVSSGNTQIAAATDGGKAALDTYLAAHSTDTALVASVTTHFATAATLTVKAIDAVIAQVITISGGESADYLAVDGTKSTMLKGGGGNDQLIGGGLGNNTLHGGGGDDTFYVRSARDTVVEDANSGNDLVWSSVDYTLPNNVEQLFLKDGARVGTGNALDNRIVGQDGNDTISGLGGNDLLQGNAGDDYVSGGDGNDTLYLGAGNDTGLGGEGVEFIAAGAGNDSISGGGGNDTLQAETGADTMSGGLGADVFAFIDGDLGTAVTDHITDFSSAQGDHIALIMMDANTLKSGDQAFAFIGTQSFHKVAGELRYEVVGGSACVMGDTNGDGVADFKLWLDGVKSVSQGDFWL
ncbi:right-handed parallel beta-helix repeat-containing protein [Phenylobacterium sp.]|uniref:right-handed parallel beta-helix repeat-containing protein n=1 Tax=Phenylobacterium sp. TaxID=1871053 RepID=UPI0025EE9711|nr:right-handed parallel beta-helix repeat-containing protein [Phenylobacterium sp.]